VLVVVADRVGGRFDENLVPSAAVARKLSSQENVLLRDSRDSAGGAQDYRFFQVTKALDDLGDEFQCGGRQRATIGAAFTNHLAVN
jgi:hypothetical protein